jgi:hypothetical protein
VAAQGEHVLHGAGGGQLVQQESAKKKRNKIIIRYFNRRRVPDPNKSGIFLVPIVLAREKRGTFN